MKTDQNDNMDQKNPTSQKQNTGNRQNTGDSKSEKEPSSKKMNDEDEYEKKQGNNTTGSGQDKNAGKAANC